MGLVNMVKFLLDKNANSLLPGPSMWSALHIASSKGFSEIVELLSFNKKLLSQKDEVGLTPLHIACAFGTLETVKILIKNGADINSKDNQGQTPLFVAGRYGLKSGDRSIVEYLKTLGAEAK